MTKKDYSKLTKEEVCKIVERQDKELANKKYGLVWDSEKEPEKVVQECAENLPILKNVKGKAIKTNDDEDNILVKGEKLIVLDYKTRGYALKEDTAEHYRQQQNIYNFLLRKNGYETEDYFFLLFYIPKEVMATGEVIFDTELVKMKVDVESAEKVWKKALEMLEGEEPKEKCEWCEGKN